MEAGAEDLQPLTRPLAVRGGGETTKERARSRCEAVGR